VFHSLRSNSTSSSVNVLPHELIVASGWWSAPSRSAASEISSLVLPSIVPTSSGEAPSCQTALAISLLTSRSSSGMPG
jgi:hypothetical protein